MGSRRRCCCKNTPNVTIQTGWCKPCTAPGTITVTITSGSCPGGSTVASGTADASGNFQTHLPQGTYCASASTTAPNYLNTSITFTVPATGSVTAASPLYPSKLTVSDSGTGQNINVFPSGTYSGSWGTITGDSGHYIGTSTYTFVGCANGKLLCSGTVTLYYQWKCVDPLTGNSQVTVYFDASQSTNPTTGYTNECPQDGASNYGTGGVELTQSPCYPLSQSGTATYGPCGLTDCDGITNLYNACNASVNVTYGVTQ